MYTLSPAGRSLIRISHHENEGARYDEHLATSKMNHTSRNRNSFLKINFICSDKVFQNEAESSVSHCYFSTEVLVLVLVDTQQGSQRSITLRSISRQQISPKIL